MVKSESTLSTREQILAAAERIVMRDGVGSLTIEAVAREAGFSKGGVLYHFDSKDKLVAAMIERLISLFEGDLEHHRNEDKRRPGSWTRAYVQATFAPGASLEDPARAANCTEVSAAMVAAITNNPKLLDPLKERFEAWQQAVEQDGIDPTLATIVRLAADGLWFSELFGFFPPNQELRDRIQATLVKMSEEKNQ
ncbi:MAG: TetR/AcrR family transcriptional regulator [Blastocatellia bacterium]|nr:TetR/AcrR family transcriptional regulator [Blastocatellia bacterium]